MAEFLFFLPISKISEGFDSSLTYIQALLISPTLMAYITTSSLVVTLHPNLGLLLTLLHLLASLFP